MRKYNRCSGNHCNYPLILIMSKILLTDADGVLLNWLDSFLQQHELSYEDFQYIESERPADAYRLIETFNESARIGYLPSIKGALSAMSKLKNDGYEIHCVTSFGGSVYARRARFDNIKKLFGNAITYIHILPLHDNKLQFLQENYNNSESYFIEDNINNANLSLQAGLRPILLSQNYNTNNADIEIEPEVICAHNWKHVIELIT
jgi:FMN phosphatase YigB (HAD superfamily)